MCSMLKILVRRKRSQQELLARRCQNAVAPYAASAWSTRVHPLPISL